MAIMNGLASYGIFSSGVSLFFIILFFCIAIGFLIYNINQNYLSTTICNIVSNPDKSQTVTYTVNNKQYVKSILPVQITNNNVTTTNVAYLEGSCTLYYPSANPDSYSLYYNPTTISGIISGVLFLLSVLSYFWFSFLKSNRDVAGVAGGLNVANSVINMFGKRRY